MRFIGVKGGLGLGNLASLMTMAAGNNQSCY